MEESPTIEMPNKHNHLSSLLHSSQEGSTVLLQQMSEFKQTHEAAEQSYYYLNSSHLLFKLCFLTQKLCLNSRWSPKWWDDSQNLETSCLCWRVYPPMYVLHGRWDGERTGQSSGLRDNIAKIHDWLNWVAPQNTEMIVLSISCFSKQDTFRS